MKGARYILALLLIAAFSISANAQTDTVSAVRSGKILFNVNCSPCHGVHREITGPMLASVPKKKSIGWLTGFIKNSQQVIVSGDPYSNHLYQQFNRTLMPAFPRLTDQDISDILLYIEMESIAPHDSLPNLDDDVMIHGDALALEGKIIFQEQCASCHAITHEQYGPALGSIEKRRPQEWLYPFIRNSMEVIQSGDEYAKDLFEQFDKKEMVPMEFLSDDEIKAVLHYITFASSSPRVEAGENGRARLGGPTQQVHSSQSVAHQDQQLVFQIFMILLILIGAVVFGYVTNKMLRYLERAG